MTRDAKALTGIRKAIASATDYGPVAADLLSGGTLPSVDNLVNLVVADDTLEIVDKEILRVLTPRGVALLRDGKSWRRLEKAWPNNIDEWTHYLHGADGNAVAKDTRVGPPRRLQWVGSPRWSRHHDRMASMSALTSTG